MAVATSLSEVHGQPVNLSLPQDQETESLVDAIVLGGHENDSKIDGNSTINVLSSLVLPKCALPPKGELDPVISFVVRAFSSQADQKSLQGYRALLDCLRKCAEPCMVRNVLLALRLSGSTLNSLTAASKRHAHLMHLIFKFDPFCPPAKNNSENILPEHMAPYQNYSLADAHLRLLVALVSSNSVFLTPAMNAIWRLVQSEAPPERSIRLHAALATMLRLVPKADLFPLLASNFPFRAKPRSELEWYSRQCLFTIKYAPAIHGRILELLVDRCLEIDVEINIEDGGEVSIHENDDDDNLFHLELDEPLNESTPDTKAEDEHKVDEMAGKLDAIMLILFEHMQETVKANVTTASQLFKMILPIFESAVLTTHKSKFVQFLVFFVCGLDHRDSLEAINPLKGTERKQQLETVSRSLCSHFIDVFLDPYRATSTRQSGACYLASFLSRASYVSAATVCESISALLNWAEAYIETVGSKIHAVDVRDQCDMHSLFYTVCQAAFYSMCFRGVDAIKYYRLSIETQAMPDEGASNTTVGLVDINPRRWTNICGHSLQPLRYCLESVRGEFLDVARVFYLLDQELLVSLVSEDQKMASFRQKKKASLISTATTLEMKRKAQGVGGLGRGSNPLDSFFPFDPYLLRDSHGFISPFYKDWEGCICTNLDMANNVKGDGVESDDGRKSDAVAEEGHPPESLESIDSTAYLKRVSPSKSHLTPKVNRAIKTPATVSGSSGDLSVKKEQQQESWRTLKRSRAPSLENGSW